MQLTPMAFVARHYFLCTELRTNSDATNLDILESRNRIAFGNAKLNIQKLKWAAQSVGKKKLEGGINANSVVKFLSERAVGGTEFLYILQVDIKFKTIASSYSGIIRATQKYQEMYTKRDAPAY